MSYHSLDEYKIPFFIKVYNRAGVFASMFLFILQIILASTNDWVILIDYNAYGEGFIELVMMIVLAITLSFEYIVRLLNYLNRIIYFETLEKRKIRVVKL